jgi:hypothetical protein
VYYSGVSPWFLNTFNTFPDRVTLAILVFIVTVTCSSISTNSKDLVSPLRLVIFTLVPSSSALTLAASFTVFLASAITFSLYSSAIILLFSFSSLTFSA